jgi:hypothetical protein
MSAAFRCYRCLRGLRQVEDMDRHLTHDQGTRRALALACCTLSDAGRAMAVGDHHASEEHLMVDYHHTKQHVLSVSGKTRMVQIMTRTINSKSFGRRGEQQDELPTIHILDFGSTLSFG